MSGNRQISDEEIFDAAPDGLIVVDRTGRVIRANRAAVGLLGRGRAELMGQPFGEMAGGSQAADFAGRESVPPGEFLIRLANGSERTVEATASRTDSGGWVIIALRDITGRKREEEEFRVRARQQARVAELGSFSQAAVRLGLPKSTVSRRVAALERLMGERLLLRTTRRQSLTEFGLQLLEHARQVVAELEAVTLDQVRAAGAALLAGPQARATIGMPAVRAA